MFMQLSAYLPDHKCIRILFLSLTDFVLSIGEQIQLTSHNYPSYYYPDYAYVLWTFQYSPGEDTTDIGYVISFGYVGIGYYDYLRVGRGWDPNNATAVIYSQGDYYYGELDDLVIAAGDIFVEFEADSYSESFGFQLNMTVQNISGIYECGWV